MSNKRKKVLIILFCIVAFMIVFLSGIFLKIIKLNTVFVGSYPVRGVDVSHYQGEIDWTVLESQGIDFAYIKATEGSSFVDDKFVSNWENATQTSLKIGAYHFFSFDSEGETQAENYVQMVGSLEGKLLPVVDVEYYGDKFQNPPEKATVITELTDMLLALEQEYGVKPMIYTTYVVYYKYLQGEFDEYPLWIRNVYFTPDVNLKDKWTFWQYSDTEVLEGYTGQEKYIDVNVFCGSLEELEVLVLNSDEVCG